MTEERNILLILYIRKSFKTMHIDNVAFSE